MMWYTHLSLSTFSHDYSHPYLLVAVSTPIPKPQLMYNLRFSHAPPLPLAPPQEVDLTHGRLKRIPGALRGLKCVEVLSLRQNLLQDLEPISSLTTLRELDLYDNELTTIHGLERLTSLTYVHSSNYSF